MSDNSTLENEPTIVKHTHFKPSYAATIMGYLLMPRPPLEEGGELRPPRCEDPPDDYGRVHDSCSHHCGGRIL